MIIKSLRALLVFVWVSTAHAQVTTSAMYGQIADETGQGLPGASIVATHLPTGTQYGISSRADGQYTLSNMRVGGPYRIQATFIGFKTETVEDVFLNLGQRFPLNIKLIAESKALQEVVVRSSGSDVLNDSRTGASSNVSAEQLRTLPTIKRSLFDYTRLNPMAGGDGSFGGRNSRYNNFSLNGAIFNNPFGLDAATPGGQTDAQPVSLDAIEQIQVALSPFDITQAGFTGASVNAVTKSGTNQFHGTAFGFFRNQNLTGTRVKGTDIIVPESNQAQFGFSLGGPIIKNKLFFFINAEADRRADLGTDGWVAARPGLSGANVSRVQAFDMEAISNLLRELYGYETGAYESFTYRTRNTKGIAKLDWNISRNHKLSVIYNFLDAFRDKPAHPSAIGRRGPDFLTLQFQNSGYRINNKLHGGIVELNSNFGGKFANKLQVGYTAFRDSRDPFSAPFPVLNFGLGGTRYIIAGHEPFSINNILDQDVYQFTNNFNIFAGKHTITLGTSLERFDFNNSFNLTGYGARVFFPNINIVDSPDPAIRFREVNQVIRSAEFAKEVADARAAFETNNRNNTWALAETNVGQWSVYAQDEWTPTPRLTLTYGLRMDLPLYFNTQDKIAENIERNKAVYNPDIQYYDETGAPVKLNSLTLPKQTPLWSPRVGFNYKLTENSSIRGGSGLFTGRFPFVWIGNQVANPAFFFYCTTSPDFKFPQVWKNSLGYDHKFGGGWVVSADLLYNRDVNAVMVRNFGLRTPSGRLQGVDNREIYTASDRATVFGGPTNAYVVTNANIGYSFNASLQLQRTWSNGLNVSAAYNFLDAQDASSIDAEISSDAFDRNPALGNVNTAVLAPSLYGNRHRFVGSGSKRFVYANGRAATTISMVAEYVRGGRYSYTYSGDINNDGSGLNDLIFIPTDTQITQMAFSGTEVQQNEQRAALRNYIAQDEYLSARRGQYAEKFGSLSPWYSNWDLRLLQDINLPNRNTVQLSLDVLNVGNLLSSDWGVRQFASYTGLAQPIAVQTTNGVPTYSFDPNLRSTFFNDAQLNSRWRMQVGVRYIF